MKKPWIGIQYWEKPVMMHWPVNYKTLRPLVPEPFELDTYRGQPWVSIVLFRSPGSHLRWGSRLFSLSPNWQVNVRTYIRFEDKPAVYFLFVYINSKLSVLGARMLLSLPYKHAYFETFSSENRMNCEMVQPNGTHFSAHVQTLSDSFSPESHTLANWLTERYLIYTIKGKHIIKAAIKHEPWRLVEAQYNIKYNNLLDRVSLQSDQPLVHAASSQKTYVYPFEKIGLT